MLLITFGLLVKRIQFFLLWLRWFVLEEGIFNSDNFLQLERFFSIYFQPPWVQYPTSSCLLLLILSSFLSFCHLFSRFFFVFSRHRFFFIFVSLLLASHSFRLTICGWLCSFNSNLLRRSTFSQFIPLFSLFVNCTTLQLMRKTLSAYRTGCSV